MLRAGTDGPLPRPGIPPRLVPLGPRRNNPSGACGSHDRWPASRGSQNCDFGRCHPAAPRIPFPFALSPQEMPGGRCRSKAHRGDVPAGPRKGDAHRYEQRIRGQEGRRRRRRGRPRHEGRQDPVPDSDEPGRRLHPHSRGERAAPVPRTRRGEERHRGLVVARPPLGAERQESHGRPADLPEGVLRRRPDPRPDVHRYHPGERTEARRRGCRLPHHQRSPSRPSP